MSIFLVGGGPDTLTAPDVWKHFKGEAHHGAAARKRDPRIAVVLFDHEGSAERFLPAYSSPLNAGRSCQVITVQVRAGERVSASHFDHVDGIVVGGGPTPEYRYGLQDAVSTISNAVSDGVPYLGFSAGAMIAPGNALIGGYLLDGREICTKEWSEGLSDVTFLPGLGLTPFAVDVHASQAGTLGRTVSSVHGGLIDEVVAIDEDTVVIVQPTSQRSMKVVGKGSAWVVGREGGQTTISVVAGN